MYRTRGRLVVACLAVIGAAIAVAGGSAGNRDGVGTLVAVPGPASVTYGESIAYKATFQNKSGAVFTQSKYVMSPPVAPGGDRATPVAASCGAFDANGVLTCDFGQIRPDGTVELTVVWKAPPGASKPGCDATLGDCLVADGAWLIKEGKTTNGNETFPVRENASLIGLSDNEAVSGNERAGGYELEGCDADNPTSLVTSQSINAATNPVATSLCLPASFVANGAAGGVATTITEPPSSSPNFARQAEVCIAAPGANCPGGTAADFGPSVVTYTFKVAKDALPSGFKITQVRHNGELLTPATCARAVNPECLVSITINNQTKLWTIVATSETNGPWNW